MFKKRLTGKLFGTGLLSMLLMAVCLSVFASRDGEWTVNPSDYRYDMSLYFTVTPEQYMDLERYEIGAFVGDECRGKAQRMDLPDGSACMYMRVRSNSASGEDIEFEIRDAATRATYDLRPADGSGIAFKADEMVGMPSEPYALTPWFTVAVAAGDHGSVASQAGEYPWGTKLSFEAVPDEGYAFSGWSDGSADNPREVTVEGDVNLEASFQIQSYSLTIYVDDEVYEMRSVTYGDPIALPEMAEKEGYTFSGWGGVPDTMPAHDVTVNGRYTLNTYKLTLVLDGEPYRVFETLYGTPLNREDFEGAEPEEREGYTFSGWSEVPETMPARDVELTGSFVANTYTLTLMLNGAEYEVMTVTYGEPLNLPTPPEMEGFTWGGWTDAPETMPAGNLTLEGSYRLNGYYLTLRVDGEVYEVKTVNYGEAIELPAMPEKEGYTFSGWSEAPATMPARNVEVTGTYGINSYKLTLILEGEVYKEETLEYGAQLVLPEPEAAEGYSFAGWSEALKTMPAHDVELTGSFAPNTYTLTLMLNGEVFQMLTVTYGETLNLPTPPEVEGLYWDGWDNAPETMPAHDLTLEGDYEFNGYPVTLTLDGEFYEMKTVLFGAPIELPEMPEREGYTFSGWGDVPATMPAYPLVLSATYEPNTYKLTLVLDGKPYREFETKYGTPLNREDFDGADPEEREGYTFAGWGEVPETMPAHDVELTGTFTANTYNVILMLNGEVYEVLTVAYGETLNLPEPPEPEGYDWIGWTDAPETMPAGNLTLEGFYKPNGYYLTIILDGEVYEMKTVSYGETIVLPEMPEKEGYTFSGWSEAPATMPARDVEVTGTYALNSYKLTLIVDGEVYKEEEVPYGTELVIPEPETKEGYTFSGWGETLKTMPAHDVEYSGSFAVNTYTLTLVLDGQVYEVYNFEYGRKVDVPAAPERDGYTFSGWKGLPETMPAESVEAVGEYTVQMYTLTVIVDGKVIRTEKLAYGTPIEVSEPELEENQVFLGWDIEIPATMPAHDLTVSGETMMWTGVKSVVVDADAELNVYDLQGRVVLRGVKAAEAVKALEPGLYIINGKKVLVK